MAVYSFDNLQKNYRSLKNVKLTKLIFKIYKKKVKTKQVLPYNICVNSKAVILHIKHCPRSPIHYTYLYKKKVTPWPQKQSPNKVVTLTSSPLESTSHILLSASSLEAPSSCIAKDNKVAIPKLAYKTSHQLVSIAYEPMFVILWDNKWGSLQLSFSMPNIILANSKIIMIWELGPAVT